jgi:hypothetical protein
VVPGFIPSWHAVLSDPGESDIDMFQNFDADIAFAAIRSTRASHFVASLVRFRCGLPGCSPPCTDSQAWFASGFAARVVLRMSSRLQR